MSARTESFTANVTKPFNITGNYFRLLAVSGTPLARAITVKFFRDSRTLNLDMDNADAGDWVRAWPDGFDRIEIASALTQSVTFQWLRGDAGSDQQFGVVSVAGVVSVSGDVSVIDGMKARTLADQAFTGVGGGTGAVAQYMHLQLMNPSGSGYRAIIQALLLGADAAQLMSVVQYDTPLASDLGACPSKRLGGVASRCHIRTESNASQLGSVGLMESYMPVSYSQYLPFKGPFILHPARGLVVRANVTGSGMRASFDFMEEPDV